MPGTVKPAGNCEPMSAYQELWQCARTRGACEDTQVLSVVARSLHVLVARRVDDAGHDTGRRCT
jgi:hypothetical protein